MSTSVLNTDTSESNQDTILIEGWLKRRTTYLKSKNVWNDRYFVLQNDKTLSYYLNRGDIKPRGIYQLNRSCIVGDIEIWNKKHSREEQTSVSPSITTGSSSVRNRINSISKKKEVVRYCIKITWLEDIPHNELLLSCNGSVDNTSPPNSPVRKKESHSPQLSYRSYKEIEEESKEENGILRHYESQMEQQALESQYQEDMLRAMEVAAKKADKRKTYKLIMQGTGVATAAGVCLTATVLSFGVGLVPTLVFGGMSAIAGGSGAMAGRKYVKNTPKNTRLVLSCSSIEEARRWKMILEECCTNAARVVIHNTILQDKLPVPNLALPTLEEQPPIQYNTLQTKWKPLEVGIPIYLALGGTHGLRIFIEEKEKHLSIVKGRLCPIIKAHLILNATPLNAFMALMTHSSSRCSFRIIETMNDHMDVIHVTFRPLYLFPSWTTPRDYCLFRYWRFDDDGSYIICYDSIQHRECPTSENYVRGEMHGVISIAPNLTHHSNECLVNYIVQVDPKGWIPTFFSYQGYVEAFAVNTLLQLLDVKDVLDLDRFVTVSLDDIHPKVQEAVKSLPLQTPKNEPIQRYTAQTLASILEPLHDYMWGEPNANSFMVRGKNYKKDNVKIHAGESAFRLITVDMVQVRTPIMTGMASHPKERIQQSLHASDTPPFIFIINIILPGPPNYHFVMYYAVDDLSTINGTNGTPFSKLANQFFFGDSDEFRDKTFKLIPCVVEGNFLVRKACGTTPAIMGTKLKQYYFRTDRYFELLLDVGSSAVAAGVVRLSVSYARTLIVDIAFLLEGDDESTLPEKVMATSRLNFVDFSKGVRFCQEPIFEDNEF